MKPHIHKWSKWSDPIPTYDGHKQQWKCCEICNKAKFRILWWDGGCITAIHSALAQARGER